VGDREGLNKSRTALLRCKQTAPDRNRRVPRSTSVSLANNSFVTLPDLPGIAFAGKADWYRETRARSD
jgi:hypothetical protein